MKWVNKKTNTFSKLKSFVTGVSDYDRPMFRLDLVAGITVALVLIPQSLAYAQLAGLPPQYGLYAALLPPMIASIFGSSRYLATGPVALMALLTATGLSSLAVPHSQEYISLALLLAIMLGVCQIIMGFLRLGALVHLLSHPVVYGFVNAAGIIIAVSQLPTLFGLVLGDTTHFYETVFVLAQQVWQLMHVPTFLMGTLAFSLLMLFKRSKRNLPGVLFTVVITTVLAWLIPYFDLGGKIVGEVSLALPQPVVPESFDLIRLFQLLPAMTIMLVVGFTETISVAYAIGAQKKQRIDANRELIGQGLANLLGGFFQSMPVAGSIARSAVNVRAGAVSAMSGVVTSGVVLLAILFFTPLLYFLPHATLAAIIIFSVSGLIDFKRFRYIWFTKKTDGIAALLTFGGTLFFAPHLEWGILLGVAFAVLNYFYRTMRPRIVVLSRSEDGTFRDAALYHLEECENIAVIRFDSTLFFANAEYLVDAVVHIMATKNHLTEVLLVGDGINEVDATGEEKVNEIVDLLRDQGKDIYFSGLRTPVIEVFEKTGLLKKIGQDHVFGTTKEAVSYLIKYTKHHQDKDHCPLKKYIILEERHLDQSHESENVAFYFHKIFPFNNHY